MLKLMLDLTDDHRGVAFSDFDAFHRAVAGAEHHPDNRIPLLTNDDGEVIGLEWFINGEQIA